MRQKFLCPVSIILFLASPILANINSLPAPDSDFSTDFISLHFQGLDTKTLHARQDSDEYRHLKRLAQDEEMLAQMFGYTLGTVMSWLSVETIATAFIEESQVTDCWHWLIHLPKLKSVIGMVGINRFKDIEDYQDAHYRHKKVYNLGGLLDPQHRGKKILSHATRHIMPLLEGLNQKNNLAIDAMIIETRPDNAPINALAKKLKFKFMGAYWKVIKLNLGSISLPIGVQQMNQYILDMPPATTN